MKKLFLLSSLIASTVFLFSCSKDETNSSGDTPAPFVVDISDCWQDSASANVLYIQFVVKSGTQKGDFLAFIGPGVCNPSPFIDTLNVIGNTQNWNVTFTEINNKQVVATYTGTITDTSAGNARMVVHSGSQTIVYKH